MNIFNFQTEKKLGNSRRNDTFILILKILKYIMKCVYEIVSLIDGRRIYFIPKVICFIESHKISYRLKITSFFSVCIQLHIFSYILNKYLTIL